MGSPLLDRIYQNLAWSLEKMRLLNWQLMNRGMTVELLHERGENLVQSSEEFVVQVEGDRCCRMCARRRGETNTDTLAEVIHPAEKREMQYHVKLL